MTDFPGFDFAKREGYTLAAHSGDRSQATHVKDKVYLTVTKTGMAELEAFFGLIKLSAGLFSFPSRFDFFEEKLMGLYRYLKHKTTCHVCGVSVGEIHQPGCDWERCPFCGGQLDDCICCYKKLGLFDREKYTSETCYLPPDIYEHGLTEEQELVWEKILEEKGRIRFNPRG